MNGDVARSRRTDPDTSQEGADRTDASGLQIRVREIMATNKKHKWTSIEVARVEEQETGEDFAAILWRFTPRFVQLEEKGLIERCGKAPRENSTGRIRNLQVWRFLE